MCSDFRSGLLWSWDLAQMHLQKSLIIMLQLCCQSPTEVSPDGSSLLLWHELRAQEESLCIFPGDLSTQIICLLHCLSCIFWHNIRLLQTLKSNPEPFPLEYPEVHWSMLKITEELWLRVRAVPCHRLLRVGPFSCRCHLSCSSTHCFRALSSTSLPPIRPPPGLNSCWACCDCIMEGTSASVCGTLTTLEAAAEVRPGLWGCSAKAALQSLGTCRGAGLFAVNAVRRFLQAHEHCSSGDVSWWFRAQLLEELLHGWRDS